MSRWRSGASDASQAVTPCALRQSHRARSPRTRDRRRRAAHVDCGDNIVIVNADKVVLTGRKRDQKIYYHHTGYAGGIKERSAKFILEGRFPERIVEKAVERMLPRGPLFRQILGNLRVYKGAEHPHDAQNPEILDIAGMNRKNKVGA